MPSVSPGARPLIATPGDPRGIGPEVVALGLARPLSRRPVVFGDASALSRAGRLRGVSLALRSFTDPREAVRWSGTEIAVFDPGDDAEPVEVAAIRAAVAACLAGEAVGLVTGPIHKARLAARGFPYTGHTDFLGALCGAPRPVMAFTGGRLRVALVTVHLPLRDVAAALHPEGVAHTVRTAWRALRADLGIDAPRLLVCGLNPHAGDSGVLGGEESRIIAPALEGLRAEGIVVEGPISAETAFRRAAAGGADLVVAMYHDQGLVPLKLVDFGESVNWTLGLPILRTSVDHGTADDIAGRGVADPRSWFAAWDLAETLAAHRDEAAGEVYPP